jgi:hypothetical protein
MRKTSLSLSFWIWISVNAPAGDGGSSRRRPNSHQEGRTKPPKDLGRPIPAVGDQFPAAAVAGGGRSPAGATGSGSDGAGHGTWRAGAPDAGAPRGRRWPDAGAPHGRRGGQTGERLVDVVVEAAGGNHQTRERLLVEATGGDDGAGWESADDGATVGKNEEDSDGQNGNRRWWPGRADGSGHRCGNPKTCSDTMLGIDLLYSIGAKGHRYSTCTGVQICRKPPNKWGNYNIQIYI